MMTAVVPAAAAERAPTPTPSAPERDAAERFASIRADLEALARRNAALLARARVRARAAREDTTLPLSWVARATVAAAMEAAIRRVVNGAEAVGDTGSGKE